MLANTYKVSSLKTSVFLIENAILIAPIITVITQVCLFENLRDGRHLNSMVSFYCYLGVCQAAVSFCINNTGCLSVQNDCVAALFQTSHRLIHYFMPKMHEISMQ